MSCLPTLLPLLSRATARVQAENQVRRGGNVRRLIMAPRRNRGYELERQVHLANCNHKCYRPIGAS
jgi:hypothetical protein